VIFDSDSFLIQINSGASQSISNDKSHFESIKPLDTNDPAGILGPTGEKSPIKGKGTIRWKIEDDNGMVHTIKLKMPCTYQHSRHVCCVLNIGANP
jgi:hypothetical protein